MRNRHVILIPALLLVLGLVLLIKPQREVLMLERRKASVLGEISPYNLSEDTDKVLSDQFLFRDNILKVYHVFKNASSKILNPKGYLQAYDREVMNIGNDYLINNVYTNDYYLEVKDNAASKGFNIKRLSLMYPDTDIYVYKPTRIEETDLLYTDIVSSPLIEAEEAFKINLGDKVTYKAMKLNSPEDYEKYYYRGDIHWNAEGAYKGYKDILELLSDKYQLAPAQEIKEKKAFEYPFYGHYANILGNTTRPDHLEDLVLGSEGSCTYIENGKITDINARKEKYIQNDTPYSAYDEYFIENAGVRVFRNKEKSDPASSTFIPGKPNVLIFCDSFINPIAEWLAYHFNNTVLIDLRNAEGFIMEDYLKEYDIDIILVMEYYENLYMNGNTYIPLD